MRHHACAKGGLSAAVRSTVAVAVMGLTLVSARAGYGQLSEGPLSPTTVVSDPIIPNAPWFPPGNATASDNLYAQAAPGGVPSQYLKATNFGFNIPAPAQIQGIEVFVERRSSAGSIIDAHARIVKGNVIGASEHALLGFWPLVDTTATYGGSSDLWGDTWTPSDINSSGFGFALSVSDGVDTAAVDHISITVHYSLCAAAPAVGCRTAQKSILVLKDNADNTKDKLVWKWIKGQSTTTAEFGDPVMGNANIALCLYDNGALKGATLVAPGPGWTDISTKGFKFLDKAGAQTGVQKIILKASNDNKAKALVKGKGTNLPDVGPFPLTGPVVVQLVNSESGLCWQSTFNAPFLKNALGSFKDKTP